MEEFVTIGGDRPRGFVLCGQQFVWRGFTPAQYSEWLGENREDGEEEEARTVITWHSLCDRIDRLILMGLQDEDKDRYRALRDGSLNGDAGIAVPVPTVSEIVGLRNWVMEVETGRPPTQATSSLPGDGNDEASSEDESGDEEETPTG